MAKIFAFILAFAALAIVGACAPEPTTSNRVVCDANVAPIEVKEVGQYGRVTYQTCYREVFGGEKVNVYFVD